jgi:tRNA G26 N,N-dimethylase Trm1
MSADKQEQGGEVVECPLCKKDAKRFGNVMDCYECGESYKLDGDVWKPAGPLDEAIVEGGTDHYADEAQPKAVIEQRKKSGWWDRNYEEFMNWVGI